jgi:pyruvate/2-oxoglutarate dehydrogenase complex dihydrolipoamide acyltransferase (E2) component
MFTDYKIAYARDAVKVRKRRRLSFLRQSVALVLSESASEIPHAAGQADYDVTPLLDYGERVIREMHSNGNKLTDAEIHEKALHKNYSAFFIKAIAHILEHVPAMNGFLDWSPLRTCGNFYESEDINLSFTVHTRFGVIKPIVRNPHKKTLSEVANEMRLLTRKCRRTDMNELYLRCGKEYFFSAVRQLDLTALKAGFIYLRARLFGGFGRDPRFLDVPEEKKLSPKDVLGATCTVANIGMSVRGAQTVTVIIPPEVCMWGLGYIHEEPRVVDGEIVPRHVMTVTLTFDHRALDGGDVFPIGDLMNHYIENPELIYKWKPGDEI